MVFEDKYYGCMLRQVENMTPISEAENILNVLSGMYKEATKRDFDVDVFYPSMTANIRNLSQLLVDAELSEESPSNEIIYNAFMLTAAHCTHAIREHESGEYERNNLAWAHILKAKHLFDGVIYGRINKVTKSMSAKDNVKKKLENDPKQDEKKFVFECWQQWQKKPELYGSKAAFARDMLDKCVCLTSQKKIEDWCREWQKAHPASRVSI
jgi:hypothetical protein